MVSLFVVSPQGQYSVMVVNSVALWGCIYSSRCRRGCVTIHDGYVVISVLAVVVY